MRRRVRAHGSACAGACVRVHAFVRARARMRVRVCACLCAHAARARPCSRMFPCLCAPVCACVRARLTAGFTLQANIAAGATELSDDDMQVYHGVVQNALHTHRASSVRACVRACV